MSLWHWPYLAITDEAVPVKNYHYPIKRLVVFGLSSLQMLVSGRRSSDISFAPFVPISKFNEQTTYRHVIKKTLICQKKYYLCHREVEMSPPGGKLKCHLWFIRLDRPMTPGMVGSGLPCCWSSLSNDDRVMAFLRSFG